MFNLSPDERLSAWADHRHSLDSSENPLETLIEFWDHPPYVPFNRNVDPYNQRSWPTPWEIIIENKYDDFTKVLMIAWTLKLTATFKDSKIESQGLDANFNQDLKINLSHVSGQLQAPSKHRMIKLS